MNVTITLPDELEYRLQYTAEIQQRSIQEIVIELLRDRFLQPSTTEHFLTPEEVVAQIQATPPNPNCIIPAQGSLLDALRNRPEDAEFDLQEWTRNFRAVEQEMAMREIIDSQMDDHPM